MPESKRVLGEGRDTAPLRPWGEREGPIAQRWEGEVGVGKRSGIPHLTPTLSAPRGGEGVLKGPASAIADQPKNPCVALRRRHVLRAIGLALGFAMSGAR